METISKCQNPPHLQDLLVPLAETHLQQVGQQNQGQDLNQNHHKKSKATTKRKTGTGKKRSTASKKKSTRRKKT